MKIFFLIFMLIIMSVLSMAYGNDEHPEWIPRDAIEAANNYWMSFYDENDDELIKHQYGLSGLYDIAQCELRFGYQIIMINYDEYEAGKSVFGNFDKTCGGRCQYAYGFAIYFNNIHIGDIMVRFKDGYWKLIGTRGFGILKKSDWFEDMISSYPSSRGYHLYKEDMGVFFVVKDDSVVTAVTGYPADKGLTESDPAEYLLEEKKRRVKAEMMRGGLDESR